MRILLLNLYYPPDTSATAKMAETVARALAEKHEVTVLCGRPSYDPAECRAWRFWQTEFDSEFASANPETLPAGNIRVLRVGSTTFPRLQMKKRLLNYLTYTALAVPRALPIRCDLVLAMTDPPFEGITGAFVALLKGKPYVYNIRDLYPDMAVGGSIVKPGLLSRIWEKLHRWALRRAARVIVLGEDMKARILAKGVSAGHVEIVRDGAKIPPHGATPPQLDQEVIRTIRGKFKFVLLHAGNLGFYGAWDTLLAAAPKLANAGIGFVFVGDGAERARLGSAAVCMNNVRFLPFFPAGKIPSVLAAPDVHLITVKRGLEGVVVPSKLYGILAAGKPVVAVAPAESDAVTLGARQGFGVAADPDRPEELVQAVRGLAADANKVEQMSRAARAAAPSYDRVGELQKFVRIIASMLHRGAQKTKEDRTA
jgi:putative colanic acid biosynthesis glycosyltransferase WcaI